MDRGDDRLCQRIANGTRGPDDSIHGELSIERAADSNVFVTKGWSKQNGSWTPPTWAGPAARVPPETLEIFSDGEIVIRVAQREGDVFKQFILTLLFGYASAQSVFYEFGLRAQMRCHVISRSDDRRLEYTSDLMPSGYDNVFEIDLATQSFAEAFLDTTVRIRRSANLSDFRKEVRAMLDSYSENYLPVGDGMRHRWLGQRTI